MGVRDLGCREGIWGVEWIRFEGGIRVGFRFGCRIRVELVLFELVGEAGRS